MIPVTSSDIASVGYKNNILTVAFHSGGIYTYSGVPFGIYTALMAADSKGKYFHANIKNVYPPTKIS